MDPVVPASVRSRSFPNVGELRSFFDELTKANVPESAISYFRLLAEMKPHDRLVRNIASVMALAQNGDSFNSVLVHGLFPVEKRTLICLDTSGVPVRYREIGHGLFNVHERWLCMRSLGKSFREAHTNKTQFLKEEEA